MKTLLLLSALLAITAQGAAHPPSARLSMPGSLAFQKAVSIGLFALMQQQGKEQPLLELGGSVKDAVLVDFSGIARGAYHLELINATGSMLLALNADVTDVSESVSLQLRNYAAGTYLLSISGKNFHQTLRLKKQ